MPKNILYINWEKEVTKYYNAIMQSYSINKKIDILEELYTYVKEIILYASKVDEAYLNNLDDIFNIVCEAEKLLPNIYIIDYKTKFNYEKEENINLKEDTNIVLDHLVFKIRKHIFEDLQNGCSDLESVNLENKCFWVSEYTQELCQKYHISSELINIFPGFNKKLNLFGGGKQHSFNIIYISNKKYIIDCTYKQFFTLRENILQRIGIYDLGGCKAGIFMMMDEKLLKVAKTILENGWIELTDENLKAYLDGFTISYRNGLYYEKNKDFTYTTNYTADNYNSFLNGESNQTNYEKIEYLGYQMQPLQNPKLSFKKR